MKFAQGPWEEAKLEIDRHRSLFKQSCGFEAPPTDRCRLYVCDPDVKASMKRSRASTLNPIWAQLMDHYELLSDTSRRRALRYASYAEMTKHYRSPVSRLSSTLLEATSGETRAHY